MEVSLVNMYPSENETDDVTATSEDGGGGGGGDVRHPGDGEHGGGGGGQGDGVDEEGFETLSAEVIYFFSRNLAKTFV